MLERMAPGIRRKLVTVVDVRHQTTPAKGRPVSIKPADNLRSFCARNGGAMQREMAKVRALHQLGVGTFALSYVGSPLRGTTFDKARSRFASCFRASARKFVRLKGLAATSYESTLSPQTIDDDAEAGEDAVESDPEVQNDWDPEFDERWNFDDIDAELNSEVELPEVPEAVYADAAHFITHLYSDLLGRTPDDKGYRDWLGRLSSFGRRGVVRGFVNSPEFRRKRAIALYDRYLHREPSASEIDEALATMEDGSGTEALNMALVLSNEYVSSAGPSAEAFVARLFEDALGRAPSDGELRGYAALLEGSDDGRALVANELFTSNKYRVREVSVLYRRLLHRVADQGGLEHWSGELGATMSWEEVIVHLAASNEYFERR